MDEILREYLDDLDIKYFFVKSLKGAEINSGYTVVYIDSDDFDRFILEGIGFERIKKDLYIIPTDDASKIVSKGQLEKVIRENSLEIMERKAQNEFIKERVEIAQLWTGIYDKILKINEIFKEKYDCHLYEINNANMIGEICSVQMLVVKNYNELHRFIDVVYYLFKDSVTENLECGKMLCDLWKSQDEEAMVDSNDRECISKFIKKWLSEDTYNCLIKFRNYFSHNRSERMEGEFAKCLCKMIRKNALVEYDFYILEYKFLQAIGKFLDEFYNLLYEWIRK